MTLELHLLLESDSTFGRGDGVAGLVDEEVEHEAATGLPYIRGRTLKGLLVEECSNLLFALRQQGAGVLPRFEDAARFLYGQGGSSLHDDAMMQIGAALLPQTLREAVAADIQAQDSDLTSAQVLESLTAIRRQTAVNASTGAPEPHSLRSMRVVLRHTPFTAQLTFTETPTEDVYALLAACVLSFRRGGTGRNRGRGKLRAWLGEDPFTSDHFARFRAAVMGEPS